MKKEERKPPFREPASGDMNGIAGGDVREPEDCQKGSLEVWKSQRESDSSSAKHNTQRSLPPLSPCVRPGTCDRDGPNVPWRDSKRHAESGLPGQIPLLFFFSAGDRSRSSSDTLGERLFAIPFVSFRGNACEAPISPNPREAPATHACTRFFLILFLRPRSGGSLLFCSLAATLP